MSGPALAAVRLNRVVTPGGVYWPHRAQGAHRWVGNAFSSNVSDAGGHRVTLTPVAIRRPLGRGTSEEM